mmetsp:Transcript_15692/g.24540  ORF Transcript_15692/g.24540 Transcript_15692/m.24540 type:complete len:91 (+) Transcript_15692:79-351(+)
MHQKPMTLIPTSQDQRRPLPNFAISFLLLLLLLLMLTMYERKDNKGTERKEKESEKEESYSLKPHLFDTKKKAEREEIKNERGDKKRLKT